MNKAGLNVQILSAHTPGVQNVRGKKGIDFAYRLNKLLIDGPMAKYPGRFQAFATLPLQNPELGRRVGTLGPGRWFPGMPGQWNHWEEIPRSPRLRARPGALRGPR